MILVGINAYHPDASVALFVNDRLVWAAEEERFTRVKHSSGFPILALKRCLAENNISISEVDYICLGKDPKSNFFKKIGFSIRNRSSKSVILNRLMSLKRGLSLKGVISKGLGVKKQSIKAKFINVEHHICHVASAFFLSGFSEAAFLSIDGLGDFTSTVWGVGRDAKLTVLNKIFYPHSAGFFYTAATQFLGFHKFGDEYKVMGLASYGIPKYLNDVRKMYFLKPQGKFELNLEYFVHHKLQPKPDKEGNEPDFGILFSEKWSDFFGNPRLPGSIMSQNEMDIAASFQAGLEEIYFHILNHLYFVTKSKNLCLAGGVAFNCVANGKIQSRTPFKNVYIQPAAGDAGTAVGAAAYVSCVVAGQPCDFVMTHALLGSEYSDAEIEKMLQSKRINYRRLTENELLDLTADELSSGKVVGWYQGKMEFGPRALGNRSILADPRIANIRDVLNEKIKRREMFRPFAPIVLREKARDFFEMDCEESPFMLKVFPVRKDKRKIIPAVTHVDGSARVQTVSQDINPRLWGLLKAFERKSGTPVLLNTSFNEHEPIVCSPTEALDCYLKTKMDILVLGNYFISRS